jgi:hypothetical protein
MANSLKWINMQEKINPQLIEILKLCKMTKRELIKKHELYLLLHNHKDERKCNTCQFSLYNKTGTNLPGCGFGSRDNKVIRYPSLNGNSICICDNIPKIDRKLLESILYG